MIRPVFFVLRGMLKDHQSVAWMRYELLLLCAQDDNEANPRHPEGSEWIRMLRLRTTQNRSIPVGHLKPRKFPR